MFVTELVFEHSKLKLRVFLTGCIVAMVTCFIKRITTTCLPTFGHLCDTSIVRSWHYETVVVQAALIHQKYKWWKELETIVSHLKASQSIDYLLSLQDADCQSNGEQKLVLLKQWPADVGIHALCKMLVQTFYSFLQVWWGTAVTDRLKDKNKQESLRFNFSLRYQHTT